MYTGGPSGSERKVFCGTSAGRTRLLFQKRRDLALALSGRQPEKKLGKQWPPATLFPDGGAPRMRLPRSWAASQRLPSPSSLTRVHLPQRGRRDLVLRKLLVAHLLGSPLGGAGTAAAVTERASGHWPARSCPRAEDEKVVKYFKKLGNMRVLFYTRVVKYLPVQDSTLPPKRSTLPGW